MASNSKRKVEKVSESVTTVKVNDSGIGLLTIGHWRVKIHNEIGKEENIIFKSLTKKWNKSNGDNFEFFDKVLDEYEFDELQSLYEYIKMMRSKETEYLSLAREKMDYENLSSEVKDKLKDFDVMDSDEIRERQAELKAYNIHLTYLSEIGHTVNIERSNYDKFIGVIDAVKASENEVVGDSFFRRVMPPPSERKTDSQFDRDYVEEKNYRMKEKNESIKKARVDAEADIYSEMS
jgi:hypothetical protein